MTFADLHIHALAGCDDGAKTEEEMQRMVDRAYRSGTRTLCLTPHYHPGYFGENREKSEEAFARLCAWASRQYPDLALYLGNELRYDKAALSWLREGKCRTMHNSRYVLVDFTAKESQAVIEKGLHRLLSGGYIPILAHVERYRSLWGKTEALQSLKSKGILLQMDAGAPLGEFGLGEKLWARLLLKQGWIDLICSDGHGTDRYLPVLSGAYAFVKHKYGTDQADRLFRGKALELIRAMEGNG